ncbi:hypothetical protein KC19_9G151600 [Ceratodon purpureus]|uniref:Uncharacterized protein n=1 Tax=Ceratodon purpureus TaxID=3225 RepID=A0A8T0GUB4_CERPU|nr:hypothetical protein KC19_9G151600 [Ceratodon purpureus]
MMQEVYDSCGRCVPICVLSIVLQIFGQQTNENSGTLLRFAKGFAATLCVQQSSRRFTHGWNKILPRTQSWTAPPRINTTIIVNLLGLLELYHALLQIIQ